METLSWYTLREILAWCPHPRDVTALARTCHALYDAILFKAGRFSEIASLYIHRGALVYSAGTHPLWDAVRWYESKPVYMDIALGLRPGYYCIGELREAIYLAASLGSLSAINRVISAFPDMYWSADFCMLHAAARGKVDIVMHMIDRYDATMLQSAITTAKHYNPNTPETTEIQTRLERIVEEAKLIGNPKLYY